MLVFLSMIKSFVIDNRRPILYVVGSAIAIALVVIGIRIYGSIQYDKGFNKRDAACIQEKADLNDARNKATIDKQKDWGKISARPNSSSGALLNRMRAQDF